MTEREWVSLNALAPPERNREWIKSVARECTPVAIAACMGDLLDRAEFAEEMARRGILERLVLALETQASGSLSDETKAILRELDEVRSVGGTR